MMIFWIVFSHLKVARLDIAQDGGAIAAGLSTTENIALVEYSIPFVSLI